MAADNPPWTRQQERVAHLPVRVPAQERAADQDTLVARDPHQHLRRGAVRRQCRVGDLAQERRSGRKELRQRDRPGALAGGLSRKRLARGQIRADPAERHLELYRRHAHRLSAASHSS